LAVADVEPVIFLITRLNMWHMRQDGTGGERGSRENRNQT